MAIKKSAAKATAFKVPVAIQTTGIRAIRAAERLEYKHLRSTGSGRKVALTFGKDEGSRGTTIYMDDIVTVVERRERREYMVVSRAVKVVAAEKIVARKPVAKRSVGSKVAAKKTSVRVESHRLMTVDGSIRGDQFEANASSAVIHSISASSATLKSEKSIIPASIKKFVLYFFDNIRKLICPRKGVKPTLSAPTTASVSTLAIWITAHFGLTVAVAGGLASAVLLVIVKATKGAFCDTAADLAKKLIAKA